jgi:hypothetical protein
MRFTLRVAIRPQINHWLKADTPPWEIAMSERGHRHTIFALLLGMTLSWPLNAGAQSHSRQMYGYYPQQPRSYGYYQQQPRSTTEGPRSGCSASPFHQWGGGWRQDCRTLGHWPPPSGITLPALHWPTPSSTNHSPSTNFLPLVGAVLGIGALGLGVHQVRRRWRHKPPPSVSVTLGMDAGHVRIVRHAPAGPEGGMSWPLAA